MTPIRVFVVDAHPSSRSATCRALSGLDLDVAGGAGAGERGLRTAARSEAGVIVVSLEGRAGPSLVGRIRALAPQSKILALTGNGGSKANDRALQAGATGALDRSTSPEEIAAGIRSVASGKRVRPAGDVPAPRRIGVRPSGVGASPLARLTPRETQMLELLSEGLTTPAIARRLYLSRRTVEFHLARAYRKLGVGGRIEAIMTYAKLKQAARA